MKITRLRASSIDKRYIWHSLYWCGVSPGSTKGSFENRIMAFGIAENIFFLEVGLIKSQMR